MDHELRRVLDFPRLPRPETNAPRTSDGSMDWHRTPEIWPLPSISGISTHLDAILTPPGRTARTFALNACFTPRVTPSLSTSSVAQRF